MKLSVNQQATIQNFSSVMTNKTKVISELIQNARRSGSTLIDITVKPLDDHSLCELTIKDDGCGIDDFEKLFVMSESGWSEKVSNTEGSFGLGFFSTLFACSSIYIESNGKAISVNCDIAKQMADFGEPTNTITFYKGTVVTLQSMLMNSEDAIKAIKSLAGFSRVPVKLNGSLLKRDKSLDAMSVDALEVIDTPFGKLVIKQRNSSDIQIVVQDLFVTSTEYSGNYFSLYGNALYSDTLKCRMPDRDKLIDSEIVIEQINNWYSSNRKDMLVETISKINDPVAFLDEYYGTVLKFAPELLLNLDYLPACAFHKVSYPQVSLEVEGADNGVRKSDELLVLNGLPCLDESPVFANFAHFSNAICIASDLPQNHWIYEKVFDAQDTEFEIRCEEAVELNYVLKYQGGGKALLAKRVTIEHLPTKQVVSLDKEGFKSKNTESMWMGIEQGELKNAAIYVDGQLVENPTLVMQVDADAFSHYSYLYSDLLMQTCSYTDEYDVRDDDGYYKDLEEFNRQVQAALNTNPETLLSEIIGELPPALAEKLNGQKMTVEFLEGKAIFKALAA